MLDGKRVLGGMRGIPNFPLSHFYAVLMPTARGRTLGVYLYTKGFMRMVLRSDAPPSWVNPADTVPEAWRER